MFDLGKDLAVENLRAPIGATIASNVSEKLTLNTVSHRGRAIQGELTVSPIKAPQDQVTGMIILATCLPREPERSSSET